MKHERKDGKASRFFGLVLAALLLSGTVCSAAEFEKKAEYAADTFNDVAESEWYASEVKSAYELGFMSGVGGGLFSPEAKVTVAEAVTMAARVHASYNGETVPTTVAEPWYQSYVDYATAHNMITAKQFDNYERNIKRYEMAEVFYSAVPESYLAPINQVDYLPDINEKASYRDKILALYNSGVVMGNDAYGMFYPNNEIVRCEAAAIINRIAIPENRLKKTLDKREDPVPAVYFIDDANGLDASKYGQFGWEFDARGIAPGTTHTKTQVLDVSKTERTAMLRTFAEQTSGKIVMESNFSFQLADDGFSIVLGKDESKQAMCFVTKDGTFHAKVGAALTDTGVPAKGRMTVKTVTDMEQKTNTLIVDGVTIGTYGFADADCSSVNTLIFTSDKENAVVAEASKTKLYSGYALNEIFMASAAKEALPDTWKLTDATGKVVSLYSNAYDSYSGQIEVAAGKTGVVEAAFDPISRKVAFEMKFYMPVYHDGAAFALTSGGSEIARITTNGGAYYTGDGVKLREYNADVWQTLRIEANTDTGVVTYSVNRKKLATGAFNAASFDGIRITLPAETAATMTIDDLFVFNVFDEEPDYVPEPVPVDSTDAIVGIEVCDIWRNGFQFGWDYTSAFDELYPYLGMYDEGSTEVADWETKWLLEHGVDFKLVCWYSGAVDAPIKTPRNSFGISAQLDSKYSEQMKYAIMWENSSNLPTNAEQFRKNILEYWKEYYLYDHDRYFTVDGKALITIYRANTLTDVFGSEEAIKTELDNIREECKKLGYEGAVILTVNGDAAAAARMGFDGIYAYNWGQNAFDPNYQKNRLNTQNDAVSAAGLTSVPTVGVGFCNMFLGQGNSRSDLIKPEDLTSLLRWVKDDFLADRAGESWQTDMLILSNWNEFGEGHYILPTNRIGFTYLDAIHDAFVAEDDTHNDLRPDDDTRARYNALYDQSRKRIRRYELETMDDEDLLERLTSTVKYDFSVPGTKQILRSSHGNASCEYTADSLKGVSSGADFAVVTAESLNLNAASGEYFRIVYKATATTEKAKGQLYFLTETDKEWNEKKAVNFEIIPDGEYHEYLVNMTGCANWKGTITSFRIDPIERGECEYEIRSIEFLDYPAAHEIYLNAESAPTPTLFGTSYENGVLSAAIDPYASLFYQKLGIFYRWDFEAKQLTLYGSDNHYIIYTMGETTAQTDKGAVTLKTAPKLVDGIPMIEIDAMAKALDLGLEIKENGYYLKHHDFSSDNNTDASLDIAWTFDLDGYLDGFTTACLEQTGHADGVVSFRSTSNGKRHDPVLNSPSISLDAVKYEKIIVGMSYNVTGGYNEGTTGISSSIFFTAPGGSFNGNDVVTVRTEGLSSDGNIIELEFDMAEHPNWDGTIGRIRFDPFEAEGTCSIDYIKIVLTNPDAVRRVVEKPNEAVLVAGEELPKGLRYAAENGSVSVIDDPEQEGVKVYELKTNANRRAWTYFNIYMQFKPGATYNISYRLYPLKDYAGNGYKACTIGGNFIYGTDGENVSNHTCGSVKVSDDAGWTEVSESVTISDSYVPSNKDCFQFWSDPINQVGVSYLVADIRIELAD